MSKFKNLSMISRVIIIITFVLAVCLITAAVAYFFVSSKMLSRSYEPDLIISSPDGQYELVVREWSCLGGAGADIYIRKAGQAKWYNGWMEKKIGTTSSDDYYYSFSSGSYYVEWENNKVTIYYCKGVPMIENVNDPSTWRGMLSYELD